MVWYGLYVCIYGVCVVYNVCICSMYDVRFACGKCLLVCLCAYDVCTCCVSMCLSM